MTEGNERPRLRAALWCNILIVLLVVLAWVVMVFFGDESALSTLGLANMKYFTVLSNILEGIVSAALAIRLAGVLRGTREGVSHGLLLWKLVAGAAVSVTFLVVALFFGPEIGYGGLYQGANFWYHLIVPLLAIGEFILLDRFGGIALRETFWAFLPPLVYGLCYCANLLVNGVGEWPDTNDFYGFLIWGLPVGLAIFAAILLMSWGSACLLRLGNRAGRREKERKG